MAFIETNLSCYHCGSSDAASIDDNGWKRCFSCGANEKLPNENYIEINTTTRVNMQTSNTEPYTLPQLSFRDIKERRLSKEVCSLYGVGYKGNDLYFTYPNGTSAQVRVNGEKQFKIVGDFGADKRLFGQDKFTTQLGNKFVIVTEGQFDAMAAHQMLGYKTPVVSIRNGVASAAKDVKANYEYLDQFEQVLFCFDSDKQGKEAMEECASIFSHKAYRMELPPDCKDANDCLMLGQQSGFVKAFWNAKKWTPQGIINAKDLLNEVLKPLAKADCDYPFEGIQKLTYGIRKGELIMVCAGSGLGKSQFLRELAWQIFKNTGDNVGCLFLEESVNKTALSLMSLAADKPLHLPDTLVSDEEKVKAHTEVFGSDRFYLFGDFCDDIDKVFNQMRAMVKALDCQYIFLDHISLLVSGGSSGDERKALDEIMTKLRIFVQETGIALIAVSHLKRPNDKGHEDGAATSLAQLRGSGSIAQLSDIVIGLERNAQADDEVVRNTTKARVLKNRFSGMTGPAGAMMYDKETGRMFDWVEPEESDDDEDEAL